MTENPNQIASNKSSLIGLHRSRDRDGFRQGWIQSSNDIIRTFTFLFCQLCLLLPPSGSSSKSDKTAGSSPRIQSLFLQLQGTSLRTSFAEVPTKFSLLSLGHVPVSEVVTTARRIGCSDWLWPRRFVLPQILGVVLAAAHGMTVGRWRFSSEKSGYIYQDSERMLKKNHCRCPPRVCWGTNELIEGNGLQKVPFKYK